MAPFFPGPFSAPRTPSTWQTVWLWSCLCHPCLPVNHRWPFAPASHLSICSIHTHAHTHTRARTHSHVTFLFSNHSLASLRPASLFAALLGIVYIFALFIYSKIRHTHTHTHAHIQAKTLSQEMCYGWHWDILGNMWLEDMFNILCHLFN